VGPIKVLGPEWSLTEAWLWVRFRSADEVVLYGGPFSNEEPERQGILTYREAVRDLGVALVSGKLVAEGDPDFDRGTVPIPAAVWKTARWGRDLGNTVYEPSQRWSDVRIPGGKILKIWPDPAAPERGKPGPKGRAFPHSMLKKALAEGFSTGQFNIDDGPTHIARQLQQRDEFRPYRKLRDAVSARLPEFRRIGAEFRQTDD
jgi:hypothetical protein